jgi:hypothetical protein
MSTSARQGSLGTFGGVFTPSVLTILGLILFLRLGFVVGHGGLIQAMIIIGLANLISVLTSLSLAAIATNLRVKGGGDYYLISRTCRQIAFFLSWLPLPKASGQRTTRGGVSC